MKRLMLAFILLVGCSSWKQKDFEADLNEPTEEAQPKVATTKVEDSLLEKFEVKAVEEKTEEVKEADKKVVKKSKSKKTVKVAPKPKTPVKKKSSPKVTPVKKVLPADYPPELLAINAKAKKVWDLYEPNHTVGEKTYLDINYLGMTVGKIMVTNKGKKVLNDKEVWHFHARFKSAPFYSNIYELDDTVDTYVTTDDFLSNKYSLTQRETKQDVDDLQIHDRDQLKTFWFYHQKKSDGSIKDKKVEKPIPYYSIDPFSMLFFFQGLPLKSGDLYEIPLINKGKISILKAYVEGREKINTEKGKLRAIRVHATTKYSGETLKSGDMYLWFSDDDHRTLLKAQAKIKIGSVTAEIVDK